MFDDFVNTLNFDNFPVDEDSGRDFLFLDAVDFELQKMHETELESNMTDVDCHLMALAGMTEQNKVQFMRLILMIHALYNREGGVLA